MAEDSWTEVNGEVFSPLAQVKLRRNEGTARPNVKGSTAPSTCTQGHMVPWLHAAWAASRGRMRGG